MVWSCGFFFSILSSEKPSYIAHSVRTDLTFVDVLESIERWVNQYKVWDLRAGGNACLDAGIVSKKLSGQGLAEVI